MACGILVTMFNKIHAQESQSYRDLDLSESTCTQLNLLGPIWPYVKVSGPIWSFLGLSTQPLWAYLVISVPMCGYLTFPRKVELILAFLALLIFGPGSTCAYTHTSWSTQANQNLSKPDLRPFWTYGDLCNPSLSYLGLPWQNLTRKTTNTTTNAPQELKYWKNILKYNEQHIPWAKTFKTHRF